MASTLVRIRPVDAGKQLFMLTPIDSNLYPDIGLPGPQPPFPGGGGGGPVDPGYSPPWAQVPVDPGYSPPWAQVPGGGGGGGGGSGPGTPVTIAPLPPSMPPPPAPAGLPPGSVPVLVFYPGERYPALAWVQPSPSSGPVTPPAETAPPAKK